MLKIISWLLLILLSSGGLTAYFLQQQYQDKSATFRILYREITIKLSQHDAIIPLLPATRYNWEVQRLFPQIIRWRPHLGSEPRRSVVVEPDGRYWLNIANQSLLIDMNKLINDLTVDKSFRHLVIRWHHAVIFERGAAAPPYYWLWEKAINSESQPFELLAGDDPNWAALPWLKILTPVLFWTLILYLFTQYRASLRRSAIADLRTHYNELTRLNTHGEMAAGIVHELNQPLTAILSYNQTALRLIQQPDNAQLAPLLAASVVQIKRIDALLQQFRQKLSSEPANHQPIALSQLWEQVLQLLDNEIRGQKIKVSSHIPESLPILYAPPLWIEQILHNIVSNAIQAQHTNPLGTAKVRLDARVRDNGIALKITDNGPGLSTEALQHVFMPFFTTRTTGIGLGMALTDTLVQRLNGSIEATNLADRGACFSLWLPLHSQEE